MFGVLHEAAASLGFEPRVILDGPIDSVVPVDIADAVIATLREALSNVARHAGATLVDVELAVGSEVLLRVCDNGRGVTEPAPTGGHGLANMAMRAHRLGGQFDVARGPVEGHGRDLEGSARLTMPTGGARLRRLPGRSTLTTSAGRCPSWEA